METKKTYTPREIFAPVSDILASMLGVADRKTLVKEYNTNNHLYQKQVKEMLASQFRMPMVISVPAQVRTDTFRCAAVIREHFDRPVPDVAWVYRNTSKDCGGTIGYPPKETVTSLARLMELENKKDALKDCMEMIRSSSMQTLAILLVGIEALFPENKPEANKLKLLNLIYEQFDYFYNPGLPKCNKPESLNQYLTTNSRLPSKGKVVDDFAAAWTGSKTSDEADQTGVGVHLIHADPMWITCGAAEFAGVRLDSLCGDSLVSKSMLQLMKETAFHSFRLIAPKDYDYEGNCDDEGWFPDDKMLHVMQTIYDNGLMTALQVRMLAEKYAAEVKYSIRLELFGDAKNPSVKSDGSAAGAAIQRMQKKLDEAKEMAERAIQAKDSAETLLAQAKKRESALSEKVEMLTAELRSMQTMWVDHSICCNEALPVQEEEEDDDEIEEDEVLQEVDSVDYSLMLQPIFQNHTIAIVGGNPNLMKKFRGRNPDALLIEKSKTSTCDQALSQADVLLFKTDSMSHVQYNKCKGIAKRLGIPVGYISNLASVELMEKEVYFTLNEILDSVPAS